jgi:uncharacterized C2H2 Zn-finger protein
LHRLEHHTQILEAGIKVKDEKQDAPRYFACGQCSKVFETQAFLNQHVQGVHGRVVTPASLNQHDRVVTPASLNQHDRVVTPASLNQHGSFLKKQDGQLSGQERGQSEGDFVCQHCSKVFTTNDYLQAHIKTMHIRK